jgi:hypothetical protein
MLTFLDYLAESVVDPRHDRLAPEIFQFGYPPKLKPLVRDQIKRAISQLEAHSGIKVVDYRLIGSILTHTYSNSSDLDINILINGDLNRAVKVAIQLSGRPVPGSPYVINYHILTHKDIWSAANRDSDGVFNVETNSFERFPRERPFNAALYWKDFSKIASSINSLSIKLENLLIDYECIKSASKKDLRNLRKLAIEKMRAMEKTAVGLVEIYKLIKQNRDSMFAKELTEKDIITYGEKNRMPENVIYKLLEKYQYLKLLNQISKIINNDGVLSAQELRELQDIFNPVCGN